MSVAVNLAPEASHAEIHISIVAFRVRSGRLEVQTVPEDRSWSLPSGFPGQSETLEAASRRTAEEQFGIRRKMTQLGAWGCPRDGIVVAFLHLVPPVPLDGQSESRSAPGGEWRDARTPRSVSGPHKIVARAMARLQQEVELGMAGFGLVRPEFTVSELRHVHEAVCGIALDPSNFRKRVARWVSEQLVEELPGRRATATRPARLYRLAE